MKNKKNTFKKPELSVEELSHALYEVNLKLQASNKQLHKQDKEKTEFYANVSHDLRSPITALSNSIEYLISAKDSISTSELEDTLLLMQRRTTYLSTLVNDIFLWASLDSSPEKVHKEPVDVRFFLEDYFYMCEADSKYKDVSLQLELEDSLDITMMMDPLLFHRVLDNLFSNALKYSSDSPYIKLSSYTKKNHLYIEVEDNGIGISSENIQKIFNRSFRVDKSRTPNQENSSGFGLSIVKSIVEHHNGQISCQSMLKKGSRFIIDLPIQPSV